MPGHLRQEWETQTRVGDSDKSGRLRQGWETETRVGDSDKSGRLGQQWETQTRVGDSEGWCVFHPSHLEIEQIKIAPWHILLWGYEAWVFHIFKARIL